MPGETGWDPGTRVDPRHAARQVQWTLASSPGRACASGRRASRREGLDGDEPPRLPSAWLPLPRLWGSIPRRLLLAAVRPTAIDKHLRAQLLTSSASLATA